MDYLETATLAADRAGLILQKFWDKERLISTKSGASDLVTQVDQAAEDAILTCIKERHPTHSILAEESGGTKEAEYLWVIDPLDGTTNYVHRLPFVAISIALLKDGNPIVAVVDNPIMQERFVAVKGAGAFLNGQEITVSACCELQSSLLATGFAYDRREVEDNNYKEFCHFTHETQGVRRLGAAALDLAFVACGRFDAYWERGLQAWDMAAGALLVEEAGGTVSNYQGDPLDFFEGRILASNKNLHSIIKNELNKLIIR